MKIITASKGEQIQVCDCHYELVARKRWYLTSKGYALTNKERGNKPRTLSMHRLIMGEPRGHFVDHRDSNPLNNQCSNLRIATESQNCQNRGPSPKNTSGYKGVTWHKVTGKWLAQIRVGHIHHHLGLFTSITEAARAYNQAALKYHGEFAYLNQIETPPQ